MNNIVKFLLSLVWGSSACLASDEGCVCWGELFGDYREVTQGQRTADSFLSNVKKQNTDAMALLKEAQELNRSFAVRSFFLANDVQKMDEKIRALQEVLNQQQELISFMAYTTESLNGKGDGGTLSQQLNRINYKLNELLEHRNGDKTS